MRRMLAYFLHRHVPFAVRNAIGLAWERIVRYR